MRAAAFHLVFFLLCTAAGSGQSAKHQDPPTTVVTVKFVGAKHGDWRTLEAIAAHFRGKTFGTDEWENELLERTRDAEQRQGYYTAEVKPEIRVIRAERSSRSVSVQLRVVEGPQFRFSHFEWQNAKVFSADELNRSMPLSPGEVFDTSKVRTGLEQLRIAYRNAGYRKVRVYINPVLDKRAGTITVIMRVHEGPKTESQ